MATKKDESALTQQKMVGKKEELPQTQSGDAASATGPPENCGGNSASSPPLVLKSGTLFLSSKGIGWTSWKKRWFILTPTSLVFFRSDPNAGSQKGNEVNLTLGGIDLNNSGSVVVKADKKLITVLFQDGRDGRTFTLKAETSEDLYEWKTALEKALSQAPNFAQSGGQNGIFGNDQADAVDGSKEPVNDKQPVKSTVLHRPILLALEDADGSPTFLEKALRFVEEYGVKVEGILRQAADVEDVERRIREYEQGKTEFSQDEDAHVIADCVKYVIRELPSSPVPASCCNALLEACRTEHCARVNAMRMALLDTFPEPNRRLLQRILMMMQIVASHKNENLMSSSAVAACMAPLLLRPLLSGECEIESNFDVGGDGSLQLLQAAAAANHAQAIVITLLEQYDKIFEEGCVSPDLYSDSDETESEEEADDDDESYEDDEYSEDDECENESQGSDDDNDFTESGTGSESDHSVKCGDDKGSKKLSTDSKEVVIESLEAEKSELQKRLTEEIGGNTILEASLKKRKKALHEQRLALEKEVARLEEELQRTREKRIPLEAGLNPSQGPTSLPAKLDEKTKADLEDITQTEAGIITWNKKVDDLGKQPEQESASISDSCNQREPNHQSKMKTATTRSRSKKMKVELEKGKRYEPSTAENSPQNQKSDKSTSAAEPVSDKRYTKTNSKKLAPKGEDIRSQTANEKFCMEKGRGSSQAPPSPSDKDKGAEPIKSGKNPEKSEGAEPTKSAKNPDKGKGV